MARSEHTKNMSEEEIKELQEKVANMTEDELIAFRNGFDPDAMGFFGEEGAEK